ncbi:hypothetical protein QVD17_33042 [Tagetes erecta]|uniref:Uncharacterized protein n=1 Tax=Tagetes erecta TaxID=13708 RepID=A0AAD8K0H1_TARER|nr:hypothetical protein QVD17_33042 [Tagetes erecta]
MGSLEGEDTAFHAELTRQILMLIDDEDKTNVGLEFQRRSVVSHGCCSGGLVLPGGYFSWSESGKTVEVPGWMERLWASKAVGTGVFIPRAVAAAGKSRRRRRNKPRKNTVNYGGIRIHG